MADQSITVSDPVTATIRAGFEFGTEFCRMLSTPEGQLILKQWREDGNAARGWFETTFANVAKFFRGQL